MPAAHRDGKKTPGCRGITVGEIGAVFGLEGAANAANSPPAGRAPPPAPRPGYASSPRPW